MKKSLKIIALSGIVALTVPVFLSISKNAKPADASSYSTSTPTTSIDLNDASASDIRSYYSDLSALSTSERQGTNLLKNLKPILKNGQKYFSYGSSATTAVWQIYEIVDRDWTKSPASAISGYNSSTNTITGYTYGTSNSNPGTNPYVHALYVNRDVTNQTKAWGNHNQDQWGINQEHVWPKSCGFNNNSPATGARGDVMHLWAGNGKVNGTYHSNYYYGYVDKTKTYDDAKSYASTLSGNLRGLSKTMGGSYSVFEPQDSDKGDIARAIFYMAARYNYLSKSDSDGIDAGNPNLEIVNSLNWAPGSSYTSSTSTKGQMGILQDLLEWNRIDPPDEWEIHRNNLCYNNYTKNRNPFIDFPEWAEFIWGKSVNGSYDSTSTGYATPNSDIINDFSGGTTPSVNSVTVSPSTLSLNTSTQTTSTLTANVSVTGGASTTVTWSSNKTNVATVNSFGVVTAVGEGTATITATSTFDNTKSGQCTVTVTQGVPSSVDAPQTLDTSVTTIATSSTYNNYSEVSTGFNWTITLGSKNSNDSALWLGSNSSKKSYMTLNNGSYTEASAIANAIGVDASSTYYAAIFQKAGGTKINNVGSVTLRYSSVGGTAPSEAWVVYSTNNGATWNVLQKVTTLSSGDTIFSSGSTISNALFGFVIHSEDYCQIKVPILIFNTPANKTLTSISLDTSDVQTDFFINDEFDYGGLNVTAHYDDSSTASVSPTNVSEPDMSTSGNKTVTVSYTEGITTVSATYTITVSEITLTSLTVSGYKTNFTVGDTFSFGGTATVSYSSGINADVTSSVTFSGYNMSNSGNQTVTVSYYDSELEDSISTTYLIYVASPVQSKYAELYSGTLVEGDYVIVYNNRAMKDAVSSNRLNYSDVTIEDGVISDPADSIIWHIAKSGNYWTIYSDDVNKYAAGNGTDNKGVLIASATDYALWTVSGSSTYEFVNKGNTSGGANANLRNNGTYGFACYSTGTGGALSLYEVKTGSVAPTSINVTVNKTFYVGDTITSSDLIVKTDTGTRINNFTFANEEYQFDYSDAASGGTATTKTFVNAVTYGEFSADVVVSVSRKAYATPTETSLTITSSSVFNEIGGSSSSLKSGSVTKGGITYDYYKSYYYSDGSSLSFGNAYSQQGYMKNATAFAAGISNATVSSSGRSVNIRYSIDGSNWILKANADTSKYDYKYLKVDCIGNSGSSYSNITEIQISFKATETAMNVSNYIMFEDTNNQCTTKFSVASGYFNNMSTSERTTFMTSNDYVISTARERFEAWARHLGKTISYENGDYVIENARVSNLINNAVSDNPAMIIVIISVVMGGIAIGGYFFIRKKKYQ